MLMDFSFHLNEYVIGKKVTGFFVRKKVKETKTFLGKGGEGRRTRTSSRSALY